MDLTLAYGAIESDHWNPGDLINPAGQWSASVMSSVGETSGTSVDDQCPLDRPHDSGRKVCSVL